MTLLDDETPVAHVQSSGKRAVPPPSNSLNVALSHITTGTAIMFRGPLVIDGHL